MHDTFENNHKMKLWQANVLEKLGARTTWAIRLKPQNYLDDLEEKS